jgi:hypothetical protein
MPLYTLLDNLLTVLVYIANKMGLQKIISSNDSTLQSTLLSALFNKLQRNRLNHKITFEYKKVNKEFRILLMRRFTIFHGSLIRNIISPVKHKVNLSL